MSRVVDKAPRSSLGKRLALLAALWLIVGVFALAFSFALPHLAGQSDLRVVLFWFLVLLVIPSFALAAFEVSRDLLTDRYP